IILFHGYITTFCFLNAFIDVISVVLVDYYIPSRKAISKIIYDGADTSDIVGALYCLVVVLSLSNLSPKLASPYERHNSFDIRNDLAIELVWSNICIRLATMFLSTISGVSLLMKADILFLISLCVSKKYSCAYLEGTPSTGTREPIR
ncbi:hypothetical protein Tco_0171710, partial [Tanacetum coccineum]